MLLFQYPHGILRGKEKFICTSLHVYQEGFNLVAFFVEIVPEGFMTKVLNVASVILLICRHNYLIYLVIPSQMEVKLEKRELVKAYLPKESLSKIGPGMNTSFSWSEYVAT